MKNILIAIILISGLVVNSAYSQQNSLLAIYGVWQGKLPCADCQYIAYRLRLDKDMNYKDQMFYYDKDVKPTLSEGTWEYNDNTITLNETGGGIKKFKVNGISLSLLDAEGNPVPGSEIVKLSRLLGDDSNMRDRWGEKRNKGIDFTSSGNEPFWGLDLDLDKMTMSFSMLHLGEPIEFTGVTTTQLGDMNTFTYYGTTPKHTISVEIMKEECTDNMSGDVSPYKVTVKHRIGKSNKTDTYYGCGRYLADKNLNALWNIEIINGKNIKDYNLTIDKLPALELNSAMEKFSGKAGCNNFFGSFEAKGNLISFGKVASTLMMCPDMTLERDVFTLLNDASFSWKIENDMLTFSDLSGNKVLELRKAE